MPHLNPMRILVRLCGSVIDERIDDGQRPDPPAVLQVFAEEDVTLGKACGGKKDAIPEGKLMLILYSPGQLHRREVVRRCAKPVEMDDFAAGLLACEKTPPVRGNTIELI